MVVSTMEQSSRTSEARLTVGLTISALVSTILLIGMGSIVRVTGHGLGCPDWPLCYGQVVPPALTGAWVEFTHRLVGGMASLQILLLGILAWRRHRARPWVFRPAIAAMGLLVVQIVLGGLHVIFEIPPVTGLIHTGVAMLILGAVTVQLASTLPAINAFNHSAKRLFRDRRFLAWMSGAAAATYLLLLTGSYVTRSGASLACPAFPLCGVSARNRLIDIQMLHRFAAFGVALLTSVTLVWLWIGQNDRRVRAIALAVGALLIAQFGLGMANVWLRLPMWSRVLHLTVASIFWVGMALLWALSARQQVANRAGQRRRQLR